MWLRLRLELGVDKLKNETTNKFVLELTKDEFEILGYVMSITNSPFACDPLKDVYEMEDDEPEDPYGALDTLAKKVYALQWKDQP